MTSTCAAIPARASTVPVRPTSIVRSLCSHVRPSRAHRGVIVMALLAVAGCHGRKAAETPASSMGARRLTNLHAFARLYGTVRWFHPSDAAAAVDWDRFAIDGGRRIIDAPDTRALRAELTALIAPFAPTVHIVGPGEQFPAEPALHPASTIGLEVVAWQHRGFGDSTVASGFASKRRHRGHTVTVPGAPFAALWQAIDATPVRGLQLRLRGKLHAANRARAQLWLRVDRGDVHGFFDNMAGRPIISSEWKLAEIVGTVDSDATRIVFGPLMMGSGVTWYDDIELAVRHADGTWHPIELKDPGFESGNLLANWSPGVGSAQRASIDGWIASLDAARPASGSTSLRLEPATKVVTDELFPDAPRPGETVDVELGAGLRARVPIALYSKDGKTVGDDPAAAQRSGQVSRDSAPAGFDIIAGIADVIVMWNVLEHFWPYWDIVSIDWNAQLDVALADALDDRSVDDHVATLQRLSAAAPDGHARTTCTGESPRAHAPFTVDQIEGHVVVTATVDKAVARGDVIVSVDGRSAATELAIGEALISGSPQWRQHQARRLFGGGPGGSTVALGLRRNGSDIHVTVPRIDTKIGDRTSRPPLEHLGDGTYYVDLTRASMADINAAIDRVAAAPSVVFDLRGFPRSNQEVLSHLLTQHESSSARAWMAVPHVIRPSHTATSIPSWQSTGLTLQPHQPHIAGRVAFLTGPEAIGAAESLLALVEHHQLGAIVGSRTAGTHGNAAEITAPTGCRTRFTGMRVTKHGGATFHLVGVQPTIPASRTIAGVLAGRDEILERALAYVRDARK